MHTHKARNNMIATALLATALVMPAGTAPTPDQTSTSISAPNLFNGSRSAYELGAWDKSTRHVLIDVKGQSYTKAELQKKVNGKWVKIANVGSSTLSKYRPYLDVNGPQATNKTGIRGRAGTKETLRVYLPATSTTKASATPERTINYLKPQSHKISQGPFGNGSTVTNKSGKNHTYATANLPASAQSAYLQKLVKGKWVNDQRLNLSTTQSGKTSRFWVYLPNPGSYDTYRVSVDGTNTHSRTYSASQRLAVPQAKTKITTWSNPSHAVASYKQGAFTGWTTGGARTVELQRWTGKKWVKASSVKSARDGVYNVKTPSTKSNATTSYRVYVPATKSHTSSTTKSTKVRHENPRNYTGYRKTIYNHIKKWCPNVTISTERPNGKYDGKALMQGRNSIVVVTGKSGNRLKHIAKHECAHILQDNAYKGDYNKLSDRMNKIYRTKGSKGLESNADCIARAIGSQGPNSYNSNCKGSRGTAASQVIKGRQA